MATSATDLAELEELSRALEEAGRAIPTLRFLIAAAIAEARRKRALTPGVRPR